MGMISKTAALAAACLLAAADASAGAGDKIQSTPFGKGRQGEDVRIFTLKSKSGVEAKISNYGGIVVSLLAPDRDGKLGDIALGYDKLEDYLKATPYFGAIVGRYANRIAKARFSLEGVERKLAANDGKNHLHGGLKGFDKVVWEAAVKSGPDGEALELKYLSKDGEEGYPGNLAVTAVYTLTDAGTLRLELTATSDKTTVCNLTNHSYFNLACGGDILKHELSIPADSITPIDGTLIPDGSFMPVKGTPFDFNVSTPIGARIGQDDPQLNYGLGYDHNWVLRKSKPGELSLAGRVYEPSSGRVLEVFTTEPGVQFYSGNFLDGSNVGKGGKPYLRRSGLCLEPQHFPDTPNKPQFPSAVLRPGESYRSVMEFRLSTR